MSSAYLSNLELKKCIENNQTTTLINYRNVLKQVIARINFSTMLGTGFFYKVMMLVCCLIRP